MNYTNEGKIYAKLKLKLFKIQDGKESAPKVYVKNRFQDYHKEVNNINKFKVVSMLLYFLK